MLNKKDGDAFLLRGKTLEKMGRPQEAIEDYSQAAKLAPRSSQPFLLRGNARMRNKQFQAGLADQKRAIRNGKIQQGELIYRDPKSGAIFRFVFIPPGTYKIGYSEQQRVKVAASSYQLLFAHNATPMREIVVGKGFFILDREIDEQQYKVFEQSAPDQPRFSDAPIRLGRLPPADNPEPSPTLSDTRPQVNVTWVDAMKFSVAFQQRLGLIVRLPTEIEWECAGRQQRDALYPWKGDVFHGWAEKKGDAATPRKFHSSTNQDVTDSGIYDLAGNVREWCLDEYRNALFEDASFKSKYVPLPYSVPHKAGRRPPRRSSTFDSATWTALGASRRSYRGGGFSDNRYNCQLPVRRNFAANEQSPAIGFRIVVLQRFPK